MKIRPMLDSYEIPGIQRIGTIEDRRMVEIQAPGLAGSYCQDLGSALVRIRIEGTLAGDDARDGFVKELRDRFKKGDPVSFVADITTATEVEKVFISDMRLDEVAGSADSFRYAITLSQHVPPPPPPAMAGLGFDSDLAGLNADIGLEAADLFDIMQVPDLLGSIPDFKDPTPPLASVLDGVTGAISGLGGISKTLTDIFGGGE